MIFIAAFFGCVMANLAGFAVIYTINSFRTNEVPEPVYIRSPPIVAMGMVAVDNGSICGGCGHFEPGYDKRRWDEWCQAWTEIARVYFYCSLYEIKIPKRASLIDVLSGRVQL